jgi:hypothetical protein
MLVSDSLAFSCYVNHNLRKIESIYMENEGLVAHTGFGPVISSLRGTRPRPLDECAALRL